MTRKVEIKALMTINCEKVCEMVRMFQAEYPEMDSNLWCLECLLAQHLDGYPFEQKYGCLEISTANVGGD